MKGDIEHSTPHSIAEGNKGLIMVFTGDGKGKTSAALGTALRACGHGMRVCMIQFIKKNRETGEVKAAQRFLPDFEILTMGRGFVGRGGNRASREEHIKAAREALKVAREKMGSGRYQLLILDEVNNAIHLGLIGVEELLDFIKEKPNDLHLILTGRSAHPAIMDRADLVTEMKDIKHPFRRGIPAQEGIDF